MSNVKLFFPNSYENNIKKIHNIKNKKIASIIILYKESDNDRNINLFFTLNWINKYFKNIFEVIIIEQDIQQKLKLNNNYNFVNYHFLYNNQKFNRGWGFNCAIKHYCNTDIIALIDSDLLLQQSFFDSIMLIYKKKYEIISPYNSIYYTSKNQKNSILSNIYSTNIKKENQKFVKNIPSISISGGILIIRKSTYLELGGFEEYKDYGCEDNAFDINILKLKKKNIYIHKEQTIHLYHNKNTTNNQILDHFNKYYINNFITTDTLLYMNNHRRKYIGNIDLYRNENNYINSIPPYNLEYI